MTTHGPGRSSPSHRANAKARCVLWCAPGTSPEPELLDALRRRREVETEVVNSGYEAFALLCTRAAQAKSTGDHAVLLLVDPAKLGGAVRVMESAAIYAASASTWAFDRASQEKLRGVTLDDIAALGNGQSTPAWPGKPTESHTEVKVAGVINGPQAAASQIGESNIVASARVPINPPTLRLTGSDPIAPPPASATPEQPPTPASHLLTDEELAMLLASEPDDDGQR